MVSGNLDIGLLLFRGRKEGGVTAAATPPPTLKARPCGVGLGMRIRARAGKSCSNLNRDDADSAWQSKGARQCADGGGRLCIGEKTVSELLREAELLKDMHDGEDWLVAAPSDVSEPQSELNDMKPALTGAGGAVIGSGKAVGGALGPCGPGEGPPGWLAIEGPNIAVAPEQEWERERGWGRCERREAPDDAIAVPVARPLSGAAREGRTPPPPAAMAAWVVWFVGKRLRTSSNQAPTSTRECSCHLTKSVRRRS